MDETALYAYARAYLFRHTEDSRWRNRAEFATGRAEIVRLLRRKWARELDYRLVKESERKFHWPLGRRPDDHPGLSDFGF